MTRPRSDRPTEPLPIWQRTYARSERGRKQRVTAPGWLERRWFWGAIAAIAVAAIGLFAMALMLGPISLPGRLMSLPTTPAGAFPPGSPGVVQTHADPAATLASGPVFGSPAGLRAVPVTALISPSQAPAARTSSPRTRRSQPAGLPIAPASSASYSPRPQDSSTTPSGVPSDPGTAPGGVPSDPGSTYADPPPVRVQPSPTHRHWPQPGPSPTPSMPDIVPSVQITVPVLPDPLPSLTDPSSLWGLLPSSSEPS